MAKRVLITVGGTGGHIYPAMALARQLRKKDPQVELLFVGGGLRRNAYFEPAAFPHQEVPSGSISLRHPLRSLRSLYRIIIGSWSSKKLIKEFNPNLIVGFGSYHTIPALLAGKWLGVPILLHEANRIPGRVNRLIAPYAALTGVHFPDTANMLKGKALQIPLPLREGYRLGTTTPEKARRYFQLDPDKPTLLVFGGSQGAQAVNHAVMQGIGKLDPDLLQKLQVLHYTGDSPLALQFEQQYQKIGITAVVKAFESRMDLAWQAATLAIARSGASTIAEQVEFEVPGIFIPFPYAQDNHQESNADFVVQLIKGGVKCLEKDFTSCHFAKTIEELFLTDPSRLKEMQQALHQYRIGSSSKELSEWVWDLIRQGN